jgi:hypothetical protein
MSGRGDNNKRGSSGRGASNQSSQGFDKTADQSKANHNKHAEGGKPSMPQKKERDQSSDRNQSVESEKD